ncbi:MAG TPA: hypothetical protein VEL76_00890, partial [Gemmataceae bacterium]|nr:hypothetical protein [Gemmataceae bacterium]
YPDARGLKRRRRSRAATQALQALHALGSEDRGGRTGAIVAEYLHRRLDLSVHEPTPAEVGAHLQRAGLSAVVANRVTAFFHACDAARFAPDPANRPAALPAEAEQVVSALEAELCSPRSS